jgi:hypothetical protein
MTDVEFFAHYGETGRIVSFFQEPATTVARRLLNLHRRHATAVRKVFNNGIQANGAQIWNGSLPADCLISLVVGQGGGDASYPAPSRAAEPVGAPAKEIRMSIDAVGKRVIFERWGEMKGANAELLIALTEPFRDATRKELARECYPFLKTSKLMRKIKCASDEVFRQRVRRCRNAIKKLARGAGDAEPLFDAVMENSQWHGYRLNPDRVRLVALSELSR